LIKKLFTTTKKIKSKNTMLLVNEMEMNAKSNFTHFEAEKYQVYF
jgi:hypothetical protein